MAQIVNCSHLVGVQFMRRTRPLRTRSRPAVTVTAQSGDDTEPRPASKFRVLAFEDSYDVKKFLDDGHVAYGAFRQCWNSSDAMAEVRDFKPDVLLLDYYLPPFTGLNVLRMVNKEVKLGSIKRPTYIIGMSSVMTCNEEMMAEGADAGFIKWEMPNWSGWEKSWPR